MTTYGDQLYQFGGVPVNAPMMHVGKAFFVDKVYGSDSNAGTDATKPLKTLANALSKATANQDQVVYFIARSNTAATTTDYQSATLDWNKDGVHLIGVNNGSMIGSRSRISNLSTATVPTPLFKVSANNCLIANLEIFHSQGSADPSAASIAMQVSGQRNVISNCQISGIGHSDLDDSGSASLSVTGSENLFKHCYIGLDTIIRATTANEVIVSGCARTMFEDCYFETYTSNSSLTMVNIAASIDRFVMFKNCVFNNVQNISSAVAATSLVTSNSTNGVVLLFNPCVCGFTNITAADNSKVQVLALDGTATGHLIGITQGVDVA